MQPVSFVFLAGDEALLAAAADVIAACSGLLACGGQVSTAYATGCSKRVS